MYSWTIEKLVTKAAEWLQSRLNISSRRIDEFLLHKRLHRSGVAHASTLPTYTNKRELRALHKLALACPPGGVALEVGSYLGASTCYLAAALSQVGGHLLCVDTWHNETMPEGERDTYAEFLMNTQGIRRQITVIRKTSSQIVPKDIPDPLNLVFIDGDHSYQAVKSDFELLQHFVAGDGIVAFHDYGNPDYEGVKKVVGEALASGKWVIGGIRDTLVWIKPAR